MKINEKNLCVFATSPPYDKEGFLFKKGEVNKAFQRRYFVLKGNLLFYFEKRGDKEPLGLIIVEGCTIELSEESDQYCFEIAFNGNRTYILSAESQESMESWMKALTCAGYEYKKLMVAELQRQLEEIDNSRNKITTDSMPSSTNVLTPKPPPRRTNPFNRPAPPLPGTGNGNNGLPLAPPAMPFINGNFGSSSQRNTTASNSTTVNNIQTGRDTSPLPPPRGINSAHGSTSSLASNSNSNTNTTTTSRSEFFIPTQAITQQLQSQQQQQKQHNHHHHHHHQQHPNNLHSTNKLPTNKVFFIDIQNHNHSLNFNEIHEQFRQLVMKDILEYQAQREIKAQPLIQL
ncbi:sesquipedalian-1 [Lucilia sericata]|uniref:sesquipedalian-1 n=1 Tax=Lucilia sericata TaxID=13632 RepID=UPI0018A87328|nr:sesquipedalian-1 [Lucilia sericata]